MLKIHKSHSKKLLLIPITSICIVTGLLGFYYLTYTPELSHAESVASKKTLADIEYMQDITSEICANTREADVQGNYQYRLIDKRKNFDGTNPRYWVAKLKDGNCWMTQNLDLDIPSSGFSTVNTDITSSWGSWSEYKPVATTDYKAFWETPNAVSSYDPGIRYCGKDSRFECTLQSSNNGGHDAQGNYYSWGAATAGQAGSLTEQASQRATQSICPKGWKLPLSGDAYNDSEGSYFKILNGISVSQATKAPYYFTLGGYIMTQSGNISWVGTTARYWSAVSLEADHSFSLYISDNMVSPTHADNLRTMGNSIRCVALGDKKEPNNNVSIEVNPTISLDVADEVNVGKSETNPSTADLKVKVSSNQPYSVNINAKEHAELTSENGDKIPSNGGALTVAENNWGIMKSGDTTYTKVTTTPELFYQAMSAGVNDILFKVGISTAPDLANGTYTTDIVITAIQN